MICFVCNICGQTNSVEALEHEPSSCSGAGCGSNIRIRALVHLLSTELFGDGYLLADLPALPAIKGLGLSDQASYASRLAAKFDYTNTYYDREPRLDITEPHPDRYGTYDFILSSDVFEHIAAPVDRAFDEAYQLLKPNGVLCLSVPFSLRESTEERFSGLHEYTVVDLSGSPVLINRTRQGALEIRDDLVFHGGVGATLEMRLFSKSDLEKKLITAGFRSLRFLSDAVPRFGIAYQGGWSLPVVARKGDFVFDKRAAGQLVSEYDARRTELSVALAQIGEYQKHLDRLEKELAERGAWVAGVQKESDAAERNLARIESEFQERSKWALQLQDDLAAETRKAAWLHAQLKVVAESKWIRLGNRLGLGPKLENGA